MYDQNEPPALSPVDLDTTLRVLRLIADDRGVLASFDAAQRVCLQKLAGEVARPDLKQRKRLQRSLLQAEARKKRQQDEQAREDTGIRGLRAQAVFPTPAALPPPPAEETADTRDDEGPRLHHTRKCYVCKCEYDRLHHFYDQLCRSCGDLNFMRRTPQYDLQGRFALLTGARVKIGYQAAIMLLRNGCHVVVTTRFPRDAAKRYALEPDFDQWADRLHVFGLDLRHTPSVEFLARQLDAILPHLDFIVHNACQTVRRPPDFYHHLLEEEGGALAGMQPSAQKLLQAYESSSRHPALMGLSDPARLSQVVSDADLLLQDGRSNLLELFPRGELDADQQQRDLRTHNSWRLTLAEVPTTELLEVMLVNAVAPFVLSAKLKPLMMKSPSKDKHIVNVSAMEGQFYRAHKTDKHPHTNMAKAALNMLTRTSAADYIKVGIHMNSVDTGWVTDEDPAHLAIRKTTEHHFSPPLDIVDGAARIVDPIFTGFLTGNHPFGQFFKDYAPTPW